MLTDTQHILSLTPAQPGWWILVDWPTGKHEAFSIGVWALVQTTDEHETYESVQPIIPQDLSFMDTPEFPPGINWQIAYWPTVPDGYELENPGAAVQAVSS